MQKFIFTLVLFLSTCIYSQIQAKGVIIYNNGPKVEVVKDLPADCIIEKDHVNLGVMYDQFGLFWLPVWNYGTPQYVLISDNEETYWEVTDEDIEYLKNEYNIGTLNSPEPSLWNKIGLKPVFVALIIFICWSIIDDKRKKETAEQESIEEQ